ncbi:MAG TPA: radical SAM protein [Dehalococcoidia bacterium]|nr:radical SAM protein [Dehalococcoidia bacterium]
MNSSDKRPIDVLIIGGFAPTTLTELEQMGTIYSPLTLLLSLSNKDSFQYSLPSVGPVALASYLRKHDIQAKVMDFYFDEVKSFDSDIIGISSTFLGIKNVIEISAIVRKENPSAIIILGGPISWSISPEILLREVPEIDYIVRGEGEQIFLELINTHCSKGNPHSVQGIAFREKDRIVETTLRVPLSFDNLPLPEWELMGIPCTERVPVLPIETSRGCPYNCVYCSEVTYWGKPVRYRSSTSVIEELLYNAEELGITTYRFTDSCFSAPTDRCEKLCDDIYTQLISNNTKINWSSYARIENLSQSLLEKMKRAGCIALDIGLEAGSTQVLRKMGRGYSRENAVQVAKAAREVGIITNFNIVVGFPGETEETVKETAEVINEAAPNTFTSFIFFLTPNTRVYTHLEEYGLNGAGLSWKHNTMTSEQAIEAMYRIAQNVSESTCFPAGEQLACGLSSIGYNKEQIEDFFKHIRTLSSNPNDCQALSQVKQVNDSFMKYW